MLGSSLPTLSFDLRTTTTTTTVETSTSTQGQTIINYYHDCNVIWNIFYVYFYNVIIIIFLINIDTVPLEVALENSISHEYLISHLWFFHQLFMIQEYVTCVLYLLQVHLNDLYSVVMEVELELVIQVMMS